MKKLYVTMLLLGGLFQFTEIKAQKGFSLSAKAIPQFSFLTNDDASGNNAVDQKSTFKAGFGIGAGYNFTERIGIGLDVLYSLQGQKYETNGNEVNRKLSYIKIPVLFSYNGDPSKTVSFLARIGPQMSILTDAKIEDKDEREIVNDAENRYNNLTIGAVANAGVQFKLSSKLYLGTVVRFDYDFSNAEDESYHGFPAGRSSVHNMTVGLEVGIKYVLN